MPQLSIDKPEMVKKVVVKVSEAFGNLRRTQDEGKTNPRRSIEEAKYKSLSVGCNKMGKSTFYKQIYCIFHSDH